MKNVAPLPMKLARLIAAKGLRADLVLTRGDGSPATPAECKAVGNDVAMLDILDDRTAEVIRAVARLVPAAESMPSPELANAAMAGRAASTRPSKPTRPRVAAKRPSR